jgi:uncharacterized protein (DUF362 family)
MSQHQHHSQKSLTRRDFLRLTGLAAAGVLLGSCAPKAAEETAVVAEATSPAAVAPTVSEFPRVAIGQAKEYTLDVIREEVAKLIDLLGGLGDVVKSGDSVAIKTNLTGGVKSAPVPGYTAIESFVTHPLVVQALIEQVQTAGAKEVFVVESVYEWASYSQWGYEEIAEATGAKLIDLNQTDPFDKYDEAPVGEGSFVYPSFIVNKLIRDVEVFMSVSKMKNHYNCGVTHTMKNLMGMIPAVFYTLSPEHNWRSEVHGVEGQTPTRLPRALIDLNRARPIHFGLIDGIMTAEAGEGPWISTMKPVQPGLLFAGKNMVSTDAVATAAMGYDPTTDYPNAPFIRGDNHLKIASELGMGPISLDKIEVVGAAIEDVVYPFTPAW